jgi:hypothetical protein
VVAVADWSKKTNEEILKILDECEGADTPSSTCDYKPCDAKPCDHAVILAELKEQRKYLASLTQAAEAGKKTQDVHTQFLRAISKVLCVNSEKPDKD